MIFHPSLFSIQYLIVLMELIFDLFFKNLRSIDRKKILANVYNQINIQIFSGSFSYIVNKFCKGAGCARSKEQQ